ACDFAQFLQVYAFAHVCEFEARRFAIDLIALLAAGIFSVVVRGHFCLSKSLISREISEVSSRFTPSPVARPLPPSFCGRSKPWFFLHGHGFLLNGPR